MNYADKLLSELAIEIPMGTEIFRKNRLDFCCGGKQTLKEACEKSNVDINLIVTQLEKLQGNESDKHVDMPLNEMTHFIIERYHNDLRNRLPELVRLASKVEQVHHDDSSCPHGLAELMHIMAEEMHMHMMKEENVLFPIINAGRGSMALMPVKVMTAEHDNHGKQLEEIHRLTKDFTPPSHACNTWRALYSGLEKFEQELMAHIHLENHVLFPRALAQT